MSVAYAHDENFSAAAHANGRTDRAQRAVVAGRAEPPRRDPERYEVKPTNKTVELLEAVIDADPRLVELCQEALDGARAWRVASGEAKTSAPGRTSHLDLRTGLVAFLLLVDAGPNFHVVNLPNLLGEVPAAARRRLGIDRLVKVPNTGLDGTEPTYREAQVTYRQLLTCLHNLGDALDPNFDGLDEAERTRRAVLQQQLFLLWADAPRMAMLADWVPNGDQAIDATLKGAWDRRPGKHGKVPRYGADGDAGGPVSTDKLLDVGTLADEPDMTLLSNLVGDDDLADLGFDPFDPSVIAATKPTATPRIPGVNRADRRALGKARRRSGATLLGREGYEVWGYAFHTTVNGGPGPCVITHAAMTPATAHPANSVLPLLRDLYDARSADPDVVRPIGDVSADGAYSVTHAYRAGIRALGGSPVFRLHPIMQEGFRLVDGVKFFNGRPVCDCCYEDLFEPYPAFKGHPTAAEYRHHQRNATRAKPFEWVANGPANSAGSRQFLAPHRAKRDDGSRGGCEHCITADGDAVFGADGLPKARCCQKPTKVFNADQLALYQDETFATREWYDDWNVRNRAEGTFGALKNLALVNWSRDYHHFVGQGHEALIAMFAVCVHNMRMIESWVAKQVAAVRRDPKSKVVRLPLPSSVPTQLALATTDDAPTDGDADVGEPLLEDAPPPPKSKGRRSSPPPPAAKPPPRPKPGPKGLPGLGADPPGA